MNSVASESKHVAEGVTRFFEALPVIARELVIRACINEELAEDIAAAVLNKLRDRWSGQCFYIAKGLKERRRLARKNNEMPTEDAVDGEKLVSACAELLRGALQRAGLSDHTAIPASEIAADLAANLWGGQSFYIVSARGVDVREDRDREIYRRFNSHNANALATEFGVSKVRIYQIVKRVREQMREAHASSDSARARREKKLKAEIKRLQAQLESLNSSTTTAGRWSATTINQS